MCAEHDPRRDSSLHAASCHACSFVAETSCECGNRYLDRALRERVYADSEDGTSQAGILIYTAAADSDGIRVERELNVELVWTGPKTHLVPTRRTEQVLLDLIAGAATDLFLVSFVAYDVHSVVTAMNQAAARGVRLRSSTRRRAMVVRRVTTRPP